MGDNKGYPDMTSTSTRRGLTIGVSMAALCIAMPAIAQTTLPGIYQNVTGSDPDGGAVLNGTIRIPSGTSSIHGTTNDTGAASAAAYVTSALGANPGAVQQIVDASNNAQGTVTVEGNLTIQAIARANNAAGNADATSRYRLRHQPDRDRSRHCIHPAGRKGRRAIAGHRAGHRHGQRLCLCQQ